MKTSLRTKLGYDFRNLRPMSGECFAEPMPESETMFNGIWIPDSAMCRAPGFVAVIVCENAIVSPAGNATIRGTVGRAFAFAHWAGQRFHWFQMDLIRYKLSVEHFLAVYFDGEWLPLLSEGHEIQAKTMGDSVPRCRYCKSTGQGNMILAGGKCPICGRTKAGRIPEKYRYGETTLDKPLSLTEEERELYGGTEQSKKTRGKVISYAGQKNRSSAV